MLGDGDAGRWGLTWRQMWSSDVCGVQEEMGRSGTHGGEVRVPWQVGGLAELLPAPWLGRGMGLLTFCDCMQNPNNNTEEGAMIVLAVYSKHSCHEQ